MWGRGRGTQFAAATSVAIVAAAFAFSAPASAQEGPEAAPADSATVPTDATAGGAETPEAEAPEEPAAPTEPAPDPGAGAEEPAPPPSGSETAPGDIPAPADDATPGEATEPASAPESCPAEADGASDCEPADGPACADGTTSAEAAATTESPSPAAHCEEAVEPAPDPPSPPAQSPPATPQAPAPQAAQTPTAAPAGNAIVLLVSESAATSAPPSPAELANRLLPNGGRVAAIIEVAVLDGLEEIQETESAEDAATDIVDPELAFDARWFQGVIPARRQGACAKQSSCSSTRPKSILIARALPWSPVGSAGAARAAATAKQVEELTRHRRTRPEARSDTERPTVAVAPATPTRDHGRRVSGGGSPGGSSGAAGLRIFAVSTLPLLLTAPVSFPTEPPPTFLPEGEPGVSPPASPG